MNIVNTSLLNGFAVAIRVLSALVLNKVLAVYVGPAGYALIGQFQNAMSIIVNLAGGVVATGVTKATAQYFDDEARQHAVWQTAIRFSLVASAFACVSLLFLRDWLSFWLLHRIDMSNVFTWLALTLPAMAVNNLLLAIVNGKKEIGIYVLSNILGSLIGMLVTGFLAMKFGLFGALVAYTINPALILIATGVLVARQKWFKTRFLWGGLDISAVRELSGFGLMALTSALTMPITHMLIRNHLANQLGLTAAGHWQATWKISEIYLMLVTTTLSVYYLPRLAEIRTSSELKAEVFKVYRFVLPLAGIGALMIFLLRDYIVTTLFTDDFAPMNMLLPWQLAGDVIKIGSWVLAYILIGRAMIKLFVITEVGFSLVFYLLTVLFVHIWGVFGVTIGYAVSYFIYWMCMICIGKYELKRMAIADV